MQVQRRAEEFLVQLDRLAGVNPSSAAAPTGGTCAAAFATMPFSAEKRSFLLQQARDNQTENGNPDVFQVLGRRYRLACGRVLLVGVTWRTFSERL